MTAAVVDVFDGQSGTRTGYQVYYSSTTENQPPYNYTSAHTTYLDRPQRDPVLRLIKGMLWDRHVQDTRFLISWPGYIQQPVMLNLTGDAPITTLYNGMIDQALYSSLISNLRGMHRSILTQDPSCLKEHNVEHANYDGFLRPINCPASLYHYVSTARTLEGYDFSRELIRNSGNPRRGRATSVTATNGPGGPAFTEITSGSNQAFPIYPWYFLDDFIDEAAAIGSWYSLASGVIHSSPPAWSEFYGIHDFRRVDGVWPYTVSFEYDYFNSRSQGVFPNANPLWIRTRMEHWHVRQTLVLSDNIPTSVSSTTGGRPYNRLPSIAHIYEANGIEDSYTRWNGEVGAYGLLPCKLDIQSINSVNGACFTSPPTATGSNVAVNLISLKQENEHRDLHQLVHANLSQLTPATYYSSAKALEGFLEVFKTNWIEFFADAGDLLALIPDLGLLLKALQDIRRLRLNGVLRLGDFLADTYLKYQFGQMPTAEAIDELNEKGPILQKRISSILSGGARTIYGDFSMPLTDGPFKDLPVTLSARSKLVVRMTDESFIRTLVGLKASGLIPSLSQLWEAYPLSFIYDWFTNLSQRYADIDTQFFFLCVDVKSCVHSVTIRRPISDSVLSAHSFQKIGYCNAKSYHRHVSYAMPSLRNSIFDFRGSNPSPSAGVGGSLAWVFSR